MENRYRKIFVKEWQVKVEWMLAVLLGWSVTAQGADLSHKKEMQRRVQERMEAQFKKADADGDGYLSRAEAEQNMPYIHRKFDLMDTDKDGRLTIKEISTHDEVAAAKQTGKQDAGAAAKPAP
jgi:hypothetical protein